MEERREMLLRRTMLRWLALSLAAVSILMAQSANCANREERGVDSDVFVNANELYAAKNYESVLTLIGQEEKTRPILDIRVLILKGLSLQVTGKMDAALEAFNSAIGLSPDEALLFMNRGLLFCDWGKCEEGLEDMNRAVQLAPTATPPLFSRARVLAAMNKHKEAIADINEAIRLDATTAEFFLLLGKEQEALGDDNTAVVSYRKALRRDAKMFEAHHAIGDIYRRQKDWPAAFVEYDAEIKIGRRDALIYFLRGSTNFFKKEYKNALADAKVANELDPGVEPIQTLIRAAEERLGLPVESFGKTTK